jgi:hypothetical protein
MRCTHRQLRPALSVARTGGRCARPRRRVARAASRPRALPVPGVRRLRFRRGGLRAHPRLARRTASAERGRSFGARIAMRGILQQLIGAGLHAPGAGADAGSRCHNGKTSQRDALQRVVRYVRDNLDKPLSLTDAAAAAISVAQLPGQPAAQGNRPHLHRPGDRAAHGAGEGAAVVHLAAGAGRLRTSAASPTRRTSTGASGSGWAPRRAASGVTMWWARAVSFALATCARQLRQPLDQRLEQLGGRVAIAQHQPVVRGSGCIAKPDSATARCGGAAPRPRCFGRRSAGGSRTVRCRPQWPPSISCGTFRCLCSARRSACWRPRYSRACGPGGG